MSCAGQSGWMLLPQSEQAVWLGRLQVQVERWFIMSIILYLIFSWFSFGAETAGLAVILSKNFVSCG